MTKSALDTTNLKGAVAGLTIGLTIATGASLALLAETGQTAHAAPVVKVRTITDRTVNVDGHRVRVTVRKAANGTVTATAKLSKGKTPAALPVCVEDYLAGAGQRFGCRGVDDGMTYVLLPIRGTNRVAIVRGDMTTEVRWS